MEYFYTIENMCNICITVSKAPNWFKKMIRTNDKQNQCNQCIDVCTRVKIVLLFVVAYCEFYHLKITGN